MGPDRPFTRDGLVEQLSRRATAAMALQTAEAAQAEAMDAIGIPPLEPSKTLAENILVFGQAATMLKGDGK